MYWGVGMDGATMAQEWKLWKVQYFCKGASSKCQNSALFGRNGGSPWKWTYFGIKMCHDIVVNVVCLAYFLFIYHILHHLMKFHFSNYIKHNSMAFIINQCLRTDFKQKIYNILGSRIPDAKL